MSTPGAATEMLTEDCAMAGVRGSPDAHSWRAHGPGLEVRAGLLHAALPVALGLGGDADWFKESRISTGPRLCERSRWYVGLLMLFRKQNSGMV
jgi:hypothetical protein